MEDFLTCPVCFEHFEENLHIPLLLACGHSLCRCCVFEISKDSLVCPLDRQADPRGIDTLPKNISLLQIASHKQSKSSYPCRIHGNRKIKYYCFGCREGLCTGCMTAHTGHMWVDVECNEGIREKLREPVDGLMRDIQKAYEYTGIYHMHLQSSLETTQECIREIREKFSRIRSVLDNKEREIIKAATEAAREARDILEEKYSNALAVMQQKEVAFREIERLACSIDSDVSNKINVLGSIHGVISAAGNWSLMPVEEMTQEFKVEIGTLNGVRKEIGKIHLQYLSHNTSDSIMKRKKIHDEVSIIN